MATVRYVGRASRVRLPGGIVVERNVPAPIEGWVADLLEGNPEYHVTRPAPPAAKPQRARPARAAVVPPVAEPEAAAPAEADGADPATVAAPAPVPVAAEGEHADG